MPYISLSDYAIYWIGLGACILMGVLYAVGTLIFKIFKK